MQKMLAQGMRAAAIAQALGITAQTVYTARSRAKKEATAAKRKGRRSAPFYITHALPGLSRATRIYFGLAATHEPLRIRR
ncbi:helix-turn-helix domain-containing protein [Pseudomonas aeruginosa]